MLREAGLEENEYGFKIGLRNLHNAHDTILIMKHGNDLKILVTIFTLHGVNTMGLRLYIHDQTNFTKITATSLELTMKI